MKYSLSTCMVVLVVTSAEAATIQVDFSAGLGERNVRLVSPPIATALPDGNKVAVGAFDLSGGFSVAANAGNLSALAQRWIEFGTDSIQTIGGEAGRFSATASGDEAGFAASAIYLWVLKTDSNIDPQVDFSDTVALNAPGADFSDIRGYGLYNAPGWVFPSGPNSIAINSNSPGIIALNGGVIGPPSTGSLTLVPEPSTTSFAALALAIFAMRRKRH